MPMHIGSAAATITSVVLICYAAAGEVMLGHLNQSGFEITDSHEDSDAIIVNTCAFINDAKSESLNAILEAAELRAAQAGKRLVVTGCLAQRYHGELAGKMPEVDVMMGFERYAELPTVLRDVLDAPPGLDAGAHAAQTAMPPTPAPAGAAPGAAGDAEHASAPAPATAPDRVGSTGEAAEGAFGHVAEDGTPQSIPGEWVETAVHVGAATVPFRPEVERVRLTPPHTAYLRVAEGCNHACTFCAIPSFRGKFRSKRWDAVLEEARQLVASGAKELNLIAEDTNQYGMDRRARGRACL